MSRDNFDVDVEKQRTIQEGIKTFFWIAFWFLVIGGYTAGNIWGK